MITDLASYELNPYRKQAIESVLRGVVVEYKEECHPHGLPWLSMASFTWNIDAAMGRDLVHHDKDEIWIAAELIDQQTIDTPEEMRFLRHGQDKCLLDQLFVNRRIVRKLSGQLQQDTERPQTPKEPKEANRNAEEED
tara:strand:+ start:5764 stop:6177 length:414 start_codon:yes stop_codon:yes gene_type:complete